MRRYDPRVQRLRSDLTCGTGTWALLLADMIFDEFMIARTDTVSCEMPVASVW
jgi:hypothetical protein